MKRLLILLSGLLLAGQLTAQEGVEITTRHNRDNSVDFIAAKRTPGTYAVQLKFDNIKNLEVPAAVVLNVRHGGVFYTLHPMDKKEPISYDYRSSWIRGAVDPAVDTVFVYRLPYAQGLSRQAVNLDDRGYILFRNEPILDFHAWLFRLEPGDTVYAMRKGTVMETADRYDPVPESASEYDLERPHNYITVEHADGTTARYAVLERGSITVKPGDTVYPDTPLGLAGSIDGRHNVVYITLRYLKSIAPSPIYPGIFALQAFIDPVFATSQGNVQLDDNAYYTPVAGEALIKAGMDAPAKKLPADKKKRCKRRYK